LVCYVVLGESYRLGKHERRNFVPAVAAGGADRWTRALRFGLSGKLLVLTVLFVMMAEVLIYVPSIANFRITWLTDRLAAAHTGALVLEAAPNGMVPESLARQILNSVGAKAIALKTGQQRRMLALSELPTSVRQDVDIRDIQAHRAIMAAFETMFLCNDTDVIRAVGPAPMGGQFVEVVLDVGPLRRAMLRYSRNILLLSVVISGFSAALVYLALHYLFVRPMRRITENMIAFRENPELPAPDAPATTREDEIGIAQREFVAMQDEITSMLHQKSHLAALGLAISKVNHDLRNLLASAQLFSDRLAGLPDPQVQRFAPKLMRALERAIAFCQSIMSYGRVQEPPPDRRPVALETLVEEVRETVGLASEGRIGSQIAIERDLIVDADPDQLYRVLLNLVRNAAQALETRAPNDPTRDQIRISGRRNDKTVIIEVTDTGPGLSPQARAHLFEAFQGSTRTGGAGLGLAIAAELVRAHGGDISLVDGTEGATFRIVIPDRAVEAETRRRERARV
jgi:signal transduction histidine kinase